MKITLKGITWNHSRGYIPMVATAQRFMEAHPEVEITWEKRSLQAFADYPIGKLAELFDLLVIDHPWAGFAAAKQILLPLEEHIPEIFLQDQASHTVGKSHESYVFDGFQSALAIDAAAPVATYRPDLLEQEGTLPPETWEELLTLARHKRVAFPGIPIDSLMNFYMMCSTQGEDPCTGDEQVVSSELGERALEQLRELASLCTKEMFEWNPIKVYEAMSSRNDIAYCPFAYGYSNYSRPGYSRYVLQATDMVSIGGHGKCRSTLGGTGIAISANCQDVKAAVEYAMYVADPNTQQTLYYANGGQPGHRSAWLDTEVNRGSNNFFKETLPALDRSYLRPRYSGYFHFQDHAGDLVRDYMQHGGDPRKVLGQMDLLYRESKSGEFQ